MTASPPGGSDVAEQPTPPAKRTDVPLHWAANPTELVGARRQLPRLFSPVRAAGVTAPLGPVDVFAIEPGSLVVLRDVHLPGFDEDPSALGALRRELEEVAGHDRFLILSITGGSAEVIGPAELRARLTEALTEAET